MKWTPYSKLSPQGKALRDREISFAEAASDLGFAYSSFVRHMTRRAKMPHAVRTAVNEYVNAHDAEHGDDEAEQGEIRIPEMGNRLTTVLDLVNLSLIKEVRHGDTVLLICEEA